MRLYNKGSRTVEFRGINIAPKQAVNVDDEGAKYLIRMYKAEFADVDDSKTVVNIPTETPAQTKIATPKKSWLQAQADAKAAKEPIAQAKTETEAEREEREFNEELAKEAAAKAE
jgi:hypothetical protein